MSPAGGKIVSVAEWGAAAAAGVKPGDRLLRLDGHEVRDVLDAAWYEADGVRAIEVRRRGRVIRMTTDAGPLGLTFEGSLFDGVRKCSNACSFCFVDQLPQGLRRSLYVKDDDYRLSLLYGNFVTLTNLRASEMARIAEQRISPLYLSWHASGAAIRRSLIGPRAERGAAAFDRLLAAGIEFHVQIVVCPGANDREILAITLRDLWGKGPGVLSVGVVPVGRSAVGRMSGAPAPPDVAGSRQVIEQLARWQRRALAERGTRWVWAADEWYLRTGLRLPGSAHYEDMPQLGNGVGIAREFLAGVRDVVRPRRAPAGEAGGRHGTKGRRTSRLIVLTGELSAPVLGEAAMLIEERLGLDIEVMPLANRLFGGEVSVAGLLGGAEIVEAVRAGARRGKVLVPDIAFEPGGLTLDGVSRAEIEDAAPGRVSVVPADGRGFARLMRREAVAA